MPQGTKEEDVDVCIVDLPGDIFKTYKAAFNYDKKLMDDIFKFGYKKNCLLNKKKSWTFTIYCLLLICNI